MLPVVTPTEMRLVDEAAPEPLDVLIARAGAAVERAALRVLGGSYGRTVNVIAGKGNNGADALVAGRRLARRGVRVRNFAVGSVPEVLPPADLVIDGAFGTGFSSGRTWWPPEIGDAKVVAVDVPSGLDALSGEVSSGVLGADVTVTFQALKPGLLLGRGPELAGHVEVADIGLDVSATSALPQPMAHLVTRDDVAQWWPHRDRTAHKWRHAVRVVAGSTAMPGAAVLCTEAALRSGSGLVALSSPGSAPGTRSEVMQYPIGAELFAGEVLNSLERFSSLVVGPGLGREASVSEQVRELLSAAPIPAVVDGDAIAAVAAHPDVVSGRPAPTVLTPHDGEFSQLTGQPPASDRIASVRGLASDLGATVLLKGPTTIVADAAGSALLVDHGDERLATAGTGDVLAGVIAALLAMGVDTLHAAAMGAWIHADGAYRCNGGGVRHDVDSVAGTVRPMAGVLATDVIDGLGPAIEALR